MAFLSDRLTCSASEFSAKHMAQNWTTHHQWFKDCVHAESGN